MFLCNPVEALLSQMRCFGAFRTAARKNIYELVEAGILFVDLHTQVHLRTPDFFHERQQPVPPGEPDLRLVKGGAR